MIFLLGGADCWGSEWRDSHLGPENGPQRTADSRARSLGELCPHRPRCQLHGSRQQLGASPNWTWDAKTGVGEKLEWGSCFYPPNREIVTCGTWLEGWETKWRSSFQRRRSRRTNDTRCAASSAPTPREAFCCFCLTWCQTEKKKPHICFSLNVSRLLATCSADQTCKIWRTSNFSLMTELSIKSNNPGETSRGWMWDCAFSGDSQYIVTGAYLHLWICPLVPLSF